MEVSCSFAFVLDLTDPRLICQNSQKLFRLVEDVQKSLSGDRALSEFPNLPGSYLKMTNAALELVKYVCQVFSLEKEIETEVQRLKKV